MVENLNLNQGEQKPKKKKIITVVIFFVIIVAVVYVLGLEGYRWWQERKEYVRMGLASDKFPFRMYTERELVEMGRWTDHSDYYDSIPTRTTPEETYAIFRQALIDGDLDKAVECFMKEKREEYKEALNQAKKEGRIPEIIATLTEIYPRDKKITKGYNDTNMVTYEFFTSVQGGKKLSHPVGFSKDINGDWKLENL